MTDPNTADLHHGEIANLEDLIDRDSLREVCRSFFDLFGLVDPRVLGARRAARQRARRAQHLPLRQHTSPRAAQRVLRRSARCRCSCPSKQTVVHPCFTGAIYHVVPIIYDDRQLGRIVLGPFLPAELKDAPASLLEVDPAASIASARSWR